MEQNKKKELKLNYKFGDCTNLKDIYLDESFDYAIDKGTLDAIAVDIREETLEKCHAYFNEIIRILNNKNGVFMIVSLLQPHVLKIILDFFILKNQVN